MSDNIETNIDENREEKVKENVKQKESENMKETVKDKTFKISNLAVNNRTTIYILLILLVVTGIWSYKSTPKEEFPEITFPYFSITTTYAATSPEDIENLITRPLEKKIKTVDGIKHVDAKSMQDVSLIFVKFDVSVDDNRSSQDLRDAVEEAQSDLPSDLDNDPRIKRISVSEIPILFINLSGDLSLPKIKEYADDLQDIIEGMTEITRVDIVGALEREIQVNVDLFKMQTAGITFDNISDAVARENLTLSGGKMDVGDMDRVVRIKGEFERADEIGDIQLKPGIYIKDIAEIKDSFKDRDSYSRLFGKNVITLQVIKKSGENSIEAVDKIKKLIEGYKKKVTSNLEITLTGDLSQQTRSNINNLFNTIILSFLIVVVVLMFFMGVDNALFAGTAVPLSMCVAFVIVPLLGFTMNVVVQIGFIIALGILVDNSIVVVENMYRHTQLAAGSSAPTSGTRAIKNGVGEVAIPILAGTLTTLAPFGVLCFWPGIMGKFLVYLPATLIISLSSSLFVAYIFNPVFASSFMKAGNAAKPPQDKSKKQLKAAAVASLLGVSAVLYVTGKLLPANLITLVILLYFLRQLVMEPLIKRFQQTVIPAVINFYRVIISKVIGGRKPLAVLAALVILLFTTIGLVRLFPPNVSLMPVTDPTHVYVYITMPSGTSVEKTDAVARMMEEDLQRILGKNNPDVEFINTSVAIGSARKKTDQSGTVDSRLAKLTVGFVEYKYRTGKHSTREYLEIIRKGVRRVPGAEIVLQEKIKGPDPGAPVNIEISGEEIPQLIVIQEEVFALIKKHNVRGLEMLKTDVDVNNPDIMVEIDRSRASRLGISTSYIGSRIRTALYGKEISKLRDGEEEYPIQLRLKKDLRDNIDNLMNMELVVAGADGVGKIPLSSGANVSFSTSYGSILRRDYKRIITLSSNVLEGYNANRIIEELRIIFQNELNLEEGYSVSFSGEQEEQAEMLGFLSFALVIGIGLIFLILVSQFNSLDKPLIVMSQVLFSFIGIFLGITIFGIDISIMMTGMGIVAVGGIVVNNGILLIDYTDQLREKGKELKEALVEACSTRLTPVLLTTISTVIGLIPLAIGLNIQFETLLTEFNPNIFWGGDNAQFWSPLAWTIIFGLCFATFLTLFVVPSMYYLTAKHKEKRLNKKEN